MTSMKMHRRTAGAFAAAAAFVALVAAAQPTQLEANKRIAIEFYDAAINREDFGAASQYLGSYYKQHNRRPPTAPANQNGMFGDTAPGSSAPPNNRLVAGRDARGAGVRARGRAARLRADIAARPDRCVSTAPAAA